MDVHQRDLVLFAPSAKMAIRRSKEIKSLWRSDWGMVKGRFIELGICYFYMDNPLHAQYRSRLTLPLPCRLRPLGIAVNWHVAMRPGERKALDKHSPIGSVLDKLNTSRPGSARRSSNLFRSSSASSGM